MNWGMPWEILQHLQTKRWWGNQWWERQMRQVESQGLVADLGVRGVWQPLSEALFDIRVVDTDAQSYACWSVNLVFSPFCCVSRWSPGMWGTVYSAAFCRQTGFPFTGSSKPYSEVMGWLQNQTVICDKLLCAWIKTEVEEWYQHVWWGRPCPDYELDFVVCDHP